MKTLMTLVIAGLTTIALVGPAEAETTTAATMPPTIDAQKALECLAVKDVKVVLPCLQNVGSTPCRQGPPSCNSWCYEFHEHLETYYVMGVNANKYTFVLEGAGTDKTPNRDRYPDGNPLNMLVESAPAKVLGLHVVKLGGSLNC